LAGETTTRRHTPLPPTRGIIISSRRSLTRWLTAGLAAAATLGATGCATVDAYSDSLLADGAAWSYGENTRSYINDTNAGITTRNWYAEPMRSMAGTRLPHSFAGRPLNTGANVIVISFGTNDASNGVDGGGGYSAEAARFHALSWIHRARAAGAGCVVWVLGNSEAYAGRPWKAAYTAYLNNLNGWIRSLGSDVSTPTGMIKLRIVDFGGIAANSASYAKDNGVHPSKSGSTWLGAMIKLEIQRCT